MSNEKSSITTNNETAEGDIQPIFQDVRNHDDDDNNNDEDINDINDHQYPTEKPVIVSFADGFRDQVRHLFEHFDQDQDGYLNFVELQALQGATTTTSADDGEASSTAATQLTENMYVMACQTLNCHPTTGLSLEALKFTYAAEGTDISKDFDAVFHADGTPKKPQSSSSSSSSGNTPTQDATTKQTIKDDPDFHGEDNKEIIYEVGVDGTIDISS